MKHTFKTKWLVLVIILTLICTSFLLSGCEQSASFVGTHRSTFVDSQNENDDISFVLYIKNDNTFILDRYDGTDITKEYSGYYKSYTESGKAQLLCVVERGFQWNPTYPDIWNPYFSVCKLDDGTLMATPGTTSYSSGAVSAFGSGKVSIITLILFD